MTTIFVISIIVIFFICKIVLPLIVAYISWDIYQIKDPRILVAYNSKYGKLPSRDWQNDNEEIARLTSLRVLLEMGVPLNKIA